MTTKPLLPNRVAIYLTAALSLAIGVLPLVADLDWTSTAGLVAGLVPILAVVYKWLDGWQAYEARSAAGLVPRPPVTEPAASQALPTAPVGSTHNVGPRRI